MVSVQNLRGMGLQPEWDKPQTRVDDTDQWIAFTSKSGAEGGIEIGIFDVGQDSTERLSMTRLELGTTTQVTVRGADEAWADISADRPAAALTFRRQSTVFCIRIPTGPQAGRQLEAIAALLTQRVPGTAAA